MTISKRANSLDMIRQNIAGSSTEDTDTRLANEIKTRPLRRRLDLSETIGVKNKILGSEEQTLAFKEELC